MKSSSVTISNTYIWHIGGAVLSCFILLFFCKPLCNPLPPFFLLHFLLCCVQGEQSCPANYKVLEMEESSLHLSIYRVAARTVHEQCARTGLNQISLGFIQSSHFPQFPFLFNIPMPQEAAHILRFSMLWCFQNISLHFISVVVCLFQRFRLKKVGSKAFFLQVWFGSQLLWWRRKLN